MRKKSPETTLKIIHAAQSLILESGLKATTMEAIAERAGIAKGTLYAYFPDKDAVAEAVRGDLIEAQTEAFAAEFVEDGPIAQRIARGLSARFSVMQKLAFDDDLLGDKGGHEAADIAVAEVMVGELERAGIADAQALVTMLNAACRGIISSYDSSEDVRAAITLLCERVLR